jgi:hypothetical protein
MSAVFEPPSVLFSVEQKRWSRSAEDGKKV